MARGITWYYQGPEPMYKTPEELAEKIGQYFSELDDETPAIADLATFLGFCDIHSLYDYKRKEGGFSSVISYAKTLITGWHERGLSSSNVAGHKFWLACNGWVEEQSHNVNVGLDLYTNQPEDATEPDAGPEYDAQSALVRD